MPAHRVAPEDRAHLGGGRAQAGPATRLVDLRPELLQELVDRDRPAVPEGEQPQQVGGLAGAPLAVVDQAAVPATHLQHAEQPDLEQVVCPGPVDAFIRMSHC